MGYVHPGGGGKDQWYHRYERRFDHLSRFRAGPAPFAIAMDTLNDMVRGRNCVAIELRNLTDEPLAVTAHLDFRQPKRSESAAMQSVVLAAGEARSLQLPLVLTHHGGGLAGLRLVAGDNTFWIPLLTHVEHVTAIIKSIEQILGETPDPAATGELEALRHAVERFQDGNGQSWRAMFEQASLLRDDLLLRRIRFDALLMVKRKPYISEQPFMDAHHLRNRPGAGSIGLPRFARTGN